jgi:hypothetical protein
MITMSHRVNNISNWRREQLVAGETALGGGNLVHWSSPANGARAC